MKENDVKPRTIFVGLDLYYSQEFVDELQNQLQQKENIIKEVREYIEKHIAIFKGGDMLVDMNIDEILEILDKGE